MGEEEKLQFKIVLLGEGCVGKTSLVLRYCQNQFNDKHNATMHASFLTKRLNVGGQRVELNIWDTAGQERFRALGPIYYRDANGAILVFDIIDEDSFQKVQSWVKELRAMLDRDVPIIIVGNKVDLERNRKVKEEDARAYAESVGATYMETSVKMNRNVNETFLKVAQLMIERQKNAPSGIQRGTSRKGVVVVDDAPEEKPSSKCC